MESNKPNPLWKFLFTKIQDFQTITLGASVEP